MINPFGQVLRKDGTSITGLYATGNTTASIMPLYPGPGATLGPAMVFGYQAAKHITGFDDTACDENKDKVVMGAEELT